MQRLWPDEIIRRAQGAVGGIDIAAFTETVAGDGRLHGMIVFMGVDADIVHDAEAEGKTGPGHAVGGSLGGQAVDGAVGPVRMPMAVQQHPVGRFVADDK